MGFFSGLDAESYDRSYSDRELIARVAMYFKPHRRRLSLAMIGIVLVALGGAAGPLLVAQGVDVFVQAGASDQLLLVLSGALFVLGFVVWLANWFRRRLTNRAVGDVILALRQDAFQAAVGQDLAFFDRLASGRVVSRITSDTREFAQVFVLITDLVSQLVQTLLLLVVLIWIELRLTLLLVLILPLIFLVALGFRRLARSVTRRGMRAMANVNAAIKEAVTGISVAKNFRQEAHIYAEFDEINRQSYSVNLQRGLVLSLVFPFLNALGGIGTAILTQVGGVSAAQGAVTVGAWFLFLRSLDRFWFPVLNLSAFWSQVQGGLSAAERVLALIDSQSSVKQIGADSPPPLQGELVFENVWFHYSPDEPVLRDFNLRIAPGENLALVGHTGAGKSSITRLISRFYEFQRGRILLDGIDIRRFDLQAYRRCLGIVSQTPFLFSGTVADNIRFAQPETSAAQIEALARRIGGGEWLNTLPEGLQTFVGERGGQLSMGQRQLVSLMRVLVQRPAVFILDEATANIDPFTESQIQEALDLILAETTSILIAHRLSTVMAADRIIVVRQGAILEEGDHPTLMRSGGHYAQLYNTYFRHQSPDYRPPMAPDSDSEAPISNP